MKQPEKKPPCPTCQKTRSTECGLVHCAQRKTVTADIPSGLTVTGRINTQTKEWQE